MNEIYNVPEDVVLNSFLLEYEEGKKREFEILPVPLKAGEAYTLRIRVSDEEVIEKNEETKEETVQSTEMEILFKIYTKDGKERKKWRYINVADVVPTYTRKIS